MPNLLMVGGGGHARVLQELLTEAGHDLAGYVAPSDAGLLLEGALQRYTDFGRFHAAISVEAAALLVSVSVFFVVCASRGMHLPLPPCNNAHAHKTQHTH